MTGDDLTRPQVEHIRAAVARYNQYLTRLTFRMHELEYPHNDELLSLALNAQRTAQALLAKLESKSRSGAHKRQAPGGWAERQVREG